jgi:hypothetical protein
VPVVDKTPGTTPATARNFSAKQTVCSWPANLPASLPSVQGKWLAEKARLKAKG